MIHKYWVEYKHTQKPRVWVYITHEAVSGYFYFQDFKDKNQMLSKKFTELNTPTFKPFLIEGGKNKAA